MSPLVRKLTWALALSGALNLFLLGFGAARWVRRPHHGMMEPGPGRHGPLPMFGQHGPALRAQHRQIFAARKAVADALARDPLDAAELERALAALRATTGESQRVLHQALLETAKRLPVEERKQLVHKRMLLDATPPPPPPRDF